jgi:hypothetical protein
MGREEETRIGAPCSAIGICFSFKIGRSMFDVQCSLFWVALNDLPLGRSARGFPDPINLPAALRAAVLLQLDFQYLIGPATDEQFSTLGAVGMLSFVAGDIPDIDMVQAGF